MKDNEIVLSNRLYVPVPIWKRVPLELRKKALKMFRKIYVSPDTYCPLRIENQTCWEYNQLESEQGSMVAAQLCQRCPQAKLKISCAFKKDSVVSFYCGDKRKVSTIIGLMHEYSEGNKYKVFDRRVLAPLKKPFSMRDVGDDRSKAQEKLADKYIENGYGILVAAARFGKTRTACVVASKLKQRTFVLAHQKELLEQFQSSWLTFSTLKENQIKINPTNAEAKKLPVSLFTYQHFLQEHGEKRLQELAKVPGLVIVDEAHRCGAPGFTKVVNAFHARYRLGITATPDRKDKLSFRIYNTFGPVTAEGGVEMLTCKYNFMRTGVLFDDYDNVPHRRRFVFLNRQMIKNEERNDIIAHRAVENVDKGYKVLIPVKGVDHVRILSELIRNEAKAKGFNTFRVCEFSASIVKGKLREEVSQKIRDGYYDVVIAIESMINVGFDAPQMSNIILNAGTYSFNNENRYQLFSRIRTRCEGKNEPLIDILTDDCKWSEMSNKGIQKQLHSMGFVDVTGREQKPKGKKDNYEYAFTRKKNSHGHLLNME